MKIAVFDSGLGGLTIFKEIIKNLNAEFIFLADTKNMPYGTKSEELVFKYTHENVKYLIKKGAQIIVIACNTATAVAIDKLRKMYTDICFIGTEPAIKLADNSDNKIILTATTITLNSKRLDNLINNLNLNDRIQKLSLNKLVVYSEKNADKEIVIKYLKSKFEKFNLKEYSHVVLGCTHFPIYKNELSMLLPKEIEIVDSIDGVCRQVVGKANELNLEKSSSNICIINTSKNDTFIKNVYRILETTDVEIIRK